MKSHTEYLWSHTKRHREFVNITSKTEEILEKSGIQGGNKLKGEKPFHSGANFVTHLSEGF